MSLLEVKDLAVTFGRKNDLPTFAVDGVSFSLDQGETLALVGESGSGKSVTALSILGLLPYPTAQHPRGSIQFQGQELLKASENTLRQIRGNQIGMIFQEPMTALNPLHSLEKQITEPFLIHKGLTRIQARSAVIDLLKLVGFPDGTDRLNAFPHQLSGGQRQRVMIAMALACDPKILIADEPTTALDVTIQAGILALLKDLQKRFRMAMLLISHDLNMVTKMADSMAVMQLGKIVEAGLTMEVLHNPKHPYTQRLIAAEPQGSPAPVPSQSPLVLEASNMKVTFVDKKKLWRSASVGLKAVDDVSLTVRAQETLGIVGESGSGKTTLAFAVLRLLGDVEVEGKIVFMGNSIIERSLRQMKPLRAQMQIIFQDPFGSLSPRLSVGQIVAEGLSVHYPDLNASERDEMVQTILREVGLDPDSRHRYPHEFSGGQRQRIAFARALILRPKLVILDEPTSALDRSIQKEIIELLRSLQDRYGLAYLFISHDLKVVRAMSHRVMVMKNGKVVEEGTAEEIFTSPKTPYTQQLIHAAFDILPVEV